MKKAAALFILFLAGINLSAQPVVQERDTCFQRRGVGGLDRSIGVWLCRWLRVSARDDKRRVQSQ